MQRLHVHVSVHDLAKSIGFYSTLFGVAPSVLKDDYAKWLLDDPRVNFAISRSGRELGVDHLGIQVEKPEELAAVAGRLKAADAAVMEQQQAVCCYARSDKAWSMDPQGVSWETFLTHGEAATYGPDHAPAMPKAEAKEAAGACCAPTCCAAA